MQLLLYHSHFCNIQVQFEQKSKRKEMKVNCYRNGYIPEGWKSSSYLGKNAQNITLAIRQAVATFILSTQPKDSTSKSRFIDVSMVTAITISPLLCTKVSQ